MDQENHSNLIERFESLLQSCGRDGMDKLIEFIRKSDFYTAPASTRFHNCHKGGLLEHSLNVYDCLCAKKESSAWQPTLAQIDDSTLIITALLHDLCKTYTYDVEFKNKKIYSDHGSKSDSNGRFDWESVPGYTINDRFPYGHGEKSVMMTEQFIELSPLERYSMRWHMGFTEPKESWNTLSSAIRKYPLILALHEADLEATYILEKEE